MLKNILLTIMLVSITYISWAKTNPTSDFNSRLNLPNSNIAVTKVFGCMDGAGGFIIVKSINSPCPGSTPVIEWSAIPSCDQLNSEECQALHNAVQVNINKNL